MRAWNKPQGDSHVWEGSWSVATHEDTEQFSLVILECSNLKKKKCNYYMFISRYHFKQKYFSVEIKLFHLGLTPENLNGAWSLRVPIVVCSLHLERSPVRLLH